MQYSYVIVYVISDHLKAHYRSFWDRFSWYIYFDRVIWSQQIREKLSKSSSSDISLFLFLDLEQINNTCTYTCYTKDRENGVHLHVVCILIFMWNCNTGTKAKKYCEIYISYNPFKNILYPRKENVLWFRHAVWLMK